MNFWSLIHCWTFLLTLFTYIWHYYLRFSFNFGDFFFFSNQFYRFIVPIAYNDLNFLGPLCQKKLWKSFKFQNAIILKIDVENLGQVPKFFYVLAKQYFKVTWNLIPISLELKERPFLNRLSASSAIVLPQYMINYLFWLRFIFLLKTLLNLVASGSVTF